MFNRKKERKPLGYLGDMNDHQTECLNKLKDHI